MTGGCHRTSKYLCMTLQIRKITGPCMLNRAQITISEFYILHCSNLTYHKLLTWTNIYIYIHYFKSNEVVAWDKQDSAKLPNTASSLALFIGMCWHAHTYFSPDLKTCRMTYCEFWNICLGLYTWTFMIWINSFTKKLSRISCKSLIWWL